MHENNQPTLYADPHQKAESARRNLVSAITTHRELANWMQSPESRNTPTAVQYAVIMQRQQEEENARTWLKELGGMSGNW